MRSIAEALGIGTCRACTDPISRLLHYIFGIRRGDPSRYVFPSRLVLIISTLRTTHRTWVLHVHRASWTAAKRRVKPRHHAPFNEGGEEISTSPDRIRLIHQHSGHSTADMSKRWLGPSMTPRIQTRWHARATARRFFMPSLSVSVDCRCVSVPIFLGRFPGYRRVWFRREEIRELVGWGCATRILGVLPYPTSLSEGHDESRQCGFGL